MRSPSRLAAQIPQCRRQRLPQEGGHVQRGRLGGAVRGLAEVKPVQARQDFREEVVLRPVRLHPMKGEHEQGGVRFLELQGCHDAAQLPVGFRVDLLSIASGDACEAKSPSTGHRLWPARCASYQPVTNRLHGLCIRWSVASALA